MKYLVILFFIISCEPQEPIKTEYKTEVVSGKNIRRLKYGDLYEIAFKSGYSDTYSFGIYANVEVGDTLYFEKNDCCFWEIKLEN